MSWNPTHVQFTVLRARNLLSKGKGGSKLSDVFVAIQLGKEKFQTSTIKNALNPEWFEQCDLMIHSLNTEIQVTVMHRGMLSDEFIGYASVPLSEYKVYDGPKNKWLRLRGKPHKPPDNKNRGELEVKLLFQVKRTEESATPQKKQSPLFKSLASAVGDKFKRSRSFRENHPFDGSNDKRRHSSAVNVNQSQTMGRSASLTFEKYKNQLEPEDSERFARYDRPGNRQSLPPSYFGTQTLPHPKGKRYGVSDDSAISVGTKSADDLDTSVSSQPGYLESMFKKEREVYQSMQKRESQSSSEDDSRSKSQTRRQKRKQAKEFVENTNNSSGSDSEGSTEIALPVVRRKSEGSSLSSSKSGAEASSQVGGDVLTEETKRKQSSKDDNFTETSFPESSIEPVFHNDADSKHVENVTVNGNHNAVNGNDEEVTPVPPERRKKITPAQDFKFDASSPEKPVDTSQVRRRPKKDRLRQLYKQGGRRYTVQGLDLHRPRPPSMFEDSLFDSRPQMSHGFSILPEDLIAVYRNMTKDELIRLVITHKAQLIRKDQYIKDMEDYIDGLLVRVMETSPRLLQNNNMFK